MKWLETFEWNLFSTTAKKGMWTEYRDKHCKAQNVCGQYLPVFGMGAVWLPRDPWFQRVW